MCGISFARTSQTNTIHTTKFGQTTEKRVEHESLQVGTGNFEDKNNIATSKKGSVPKSGVSLTDKAATSDLIKNMIVNPAAEAIVPAVVALALGRNWKKGMAMG